MRGGNTLKSFAIDILRVHTHASLRTIIKQHTENSKFQQWGGELLLKKTATFKSFKVTLNIAESGEKAGGNDI